MRLRLAFAVATIIFAAAVGAPFALADDAPSTPPSDGAAAVVSTVEATPAEPVTTAVVEPAAAPAAPTPAPAPSRTRPQPRIASTLSLHATDATVVYGTAVTLTGDLSPAIAGSTVLVEQVNASGAWATVASTTTTATGSYSRSFTPVRSSAVRVRMADNSATSTSYAQTVTPRLTITKLPASPAFVGSRLVGHVAPAGWRGRIKISVSYAGKVRSQITVRPAANGKIVATVPTTGIGSLPVALALPASAGLSARTVTTRVKSTWRTLSSGSRGRDVSALLTRLRSLNYHVPGHTSHYDLRVGEVVLAFRKVHGLRRTYSVDRSLYRQLAIARPERAHFSSPGTHIEVNKTRQYLLVVKNGKVAGIIHVSTGATGNTPVGRFHIYQRGGSHLFKFMAFIGNFGIHGYVPVPAFPASHGCVREPMWAAAWTWSQVSTGTTVIVYT